MCGIYLNRDNVCKFLGKKKIYIYIYICFELLKFIKPFSDKRMQTISFWQLGGEKKYVCGGKKSSFIFNFFLNEEIV